MSGASLALNHKLADSGDGRRRYTCPSLEFESDDGRRFDAPGFQPVEVYEAAVANLDPTLERRAEPDSIEELLDWAGYPLATVEVATVMGIDTADARALLAGRAGFTPVGGDGYWSLARAAAAHRRLTHSEVKDGPMPETTRIWRPSECPARGRARARSSS